MLFLFGFYLNAVSSYIGIFTGERGLSLLFAKWRASFYVCKFKSNNIYPPEIKLNSINRDINIALFSAACPKQGQFLLANGNWQIRHNNRSKLKYTKTGGLS